MNIKEFAQMVLISLGLAMLIFLVAAADSMPMWVLLVVALIFWVVWVVQILRETRAGVKLKVMIDGEWVPIEDLTPEQTARHLYHSPSPVQLFDQDRETQ